MTCLINISQLDLVPDILVGGLNCKTQVAAGVDCLIGETLGHGGNVGIALRTPDYFGRIGNASAMRLFLGRTGKSGIVLATEIHRSLSALELIGEL